MQWLNYHHLYYFYVIASENGVTKASAKLHIAQSTLSAQLSQFESDIGFRLFERANKKLILTEMGRRIYSYADEIFRLGSELKDLIRDRALSDTVKCQVGVLDTIPKAIAARIVQPGLADPTAQVSVREGTFPALLSDLREHRIDLLITNIQAQSSESFKVFHHAGPALEIAIVGHPQFAQLAADFPRGLHNAPFVLPLPGDPTRTQADQFFALNHLHPRLRAETQDMELLRTLVLGGVGLSVLAREAVGAELASGQLVPLSPNVLFREQIWILTAHRKIQNPIAKVILDAAT